MPAAQRSTQRVRETAPLLARGPVGPRQFRGIPDGSRSGTAPQRRTHRRRLRQAHVRRSPAPDELEELEFVPHQNEHLRILGSLSERMTVELARRSTCIVTTAEPGFITCDEPVLLADEVSVGKRKGRLVGVRGLADAPAVIFPLDPKTLLVYGQPGSDLPSHLRVDGRDARDLIEDVEQIVASNAYRWIIAHPSNTRAKRIRVPAPRPILTVTDGSGAERIPGFQATHRNLRSKYPVDPSKR
ncbi:DUF4238 domain-containing protein [Promicromonospora soli]